MVEKNPWCKNVSGPFPETYGPVGVKADGGGCMAGRGLVGPMRLHRAAHARVRGVVLGGACDQPRRRA